MTAAQSGGSLHPSLDRVHDALLRGGHRPKVTRGTHIQARCPCHEDRTASLSVDWRPDRDGMTVIHCFACDASMTAQDFAAAVGLEMTDLFDAEPKTRGSGRAPGGPERAKKNRLGPRPARIAAPAAPRVAAGVWEQVTAYDYATVEGELVGQVVREERGSGDTREKRFRQRRPDGQGWVWEKPQTVVLYRAPEVAAAIATDRTVWLCEGEKDADALAAAGECATTNAGGAGSFTASHAAQLRGARVVCVLDRDGAGYRRAATVAQLTQGIAAAVQFRLPAVLAEHADLTDHLQAGLGLDELVLLGPAEAALRAALAGIEELRRSVAVAKAEAGAQLQVAERARERDSGRGAERREGLARRWAVEAVRDAQKAIDLAAAVDAAVTLPERAGLDELVAEVHRAAQTVAAAAVDLSRRVGQEPPADLTRRALGERPTAAAATAAAGGAAAQPAPVDGSPAAAGGGRGGRSGGGRVVQFPGGDDGRGAGGGAGPSVRVTQRRFELLDGQIVRWETSNGADRARLVLSPPVTVVCVQRPAGPSTLGASESARRAAAGADRSVTHYVLGYGDPVSGEELTHRVEAKDFDSGRFLAAFPIPLTFDSRSSGRAEVCDAIKAVTVGQSGAIPIERIFTETGWAELPGGQVGFIHAGGAVTADGTVLVSTQLPGPLSFYDLPDPTSDPAVIGAAWRAHVAPLLRRLPGHVGAMVVGAALRAVLGRTQSTTAVVGRHQTYKSVIASQAMNFFGADWSRNRPTLSMSRTATTLNATRNVFAAARNVLVFCDDFAPDHGYAEAAKRQGEVARMLYNAETKVANDRNNTTHTGSSPNSSVITTAEMPPPPGSARDRVAIVEVTPGDMDLDTVFALDTRESREARALLGASLISWVAGRLEDRLAWAGEQKHRNFLRLRRAHPTATGRALEPAADIEVGWQLFGEFLLATGAAEPAEVDQMLTEAHTALGDNAERQEDPDQPSDVNERIRRLLVAAFTELAVHVTQIGGRTPPLPDALLLGWRRLELSGPPQPGGYEEKFRLDARGTQVGVVNDTGTRLYLHPGTLTSALKSLLARSGEGWDVDEAHVQLALVDGGLLASAVEGAAQPRVRYQLKRATAAGHGHKQRMWDVNLRGLFDEPAAPEDSAGPGGHCGPVGPAGLFGAAHPGRPQPLDEETPGEQGGDGDTVTGEDPAELPAAARATAPLLVPAPDALPDHPAADHPAADPAPRTARVSDLAGRPDTDSRPDAGSGIDQRPVITEKESLVLEDRERVLRHLDIEPRQFRAASGELVTWGVGDTDQEPCEVCDQITGTVVVTVINLPVFVHPRCYARLDPTYQQGPELVVPDLRTAPAAATAPAAGPLTTSNFERVLWPGGAPLTSPPPTSVPAVAEAGQRDRSPARPAWAKPRPEPLRSQQPPPTNAHSAGPAPAAAASPVPAGGGDRAARRAAPEFTAAVAVADVDGIHLPDGRTHPLPSPLEHAGQLAAAATDLRLGNTLYAGKTARGTEAGQIWLTTALCAQLGLPTGLPEETRARTRALTVWAKANSWLTAAADAGWRYTGNAQGDLADPPLVPWQKTWLPGSSNVRAVELVYQPMVTFDRVQALLVTDPDDPAAEPGWPAPAVLARRLQAFADAAPVMFRRTPGVTGHEAVKQRSRGKKISVFDTEFPAFPDVAAAAGVEGVFLWGRELTGAEQRMPVVHGYDARACYVAACSSLELGVGQAEHRAGPDADAAWDPNGRVPGYWRVQAPVWEQWGLPDPVDPGAAGRRAGQWQWVASPTLRLMRGELGWDVPVAEAWVWPTHTRHLDTWYEGWRDATATLRAAEDGGDPDAGAARRLVKACYAASFGKFAAEDLADRQSRLYRPDWAHTIRAQARANIYRQLLRAGETTGRWPVAVDRDAVYYAAEDLDPVTAAPEGLNMTGRFGHLKPERSYPVAQWLTRADPGLPSIAGRVVDPPPAAVAERRAAQRAADQAQHLARARTAG